MQDRAWGCGSVDRVLVNLVQSLQFDLEYHVKLGLVVHVYNPNTQETETGGLGALPAWA